jgi:hypothetical protein
MSTYEQFGSKFYVSSAQSRVQYDKLPAGNYIVCLDMFENFYLESIEPFTLPQKLYGDIKSKTVRTLATFAERETSTGVLMAGEKGSGKTLLSRNISIEGAKIGYPTIVINHAHFGDEFNKFIQDINQPCIVLFDEVEKVYTREQQEKLLTLFDGTFSTKKLFICTCNDMYKLDENLLNRPGRLYYFFKYYGLDSDFITEYCQDNLQQIKHLEKLLEIASMFNAFNFDMLKSIVEEMNRYNESPEQVLALLNATPEHSDNSEFSIIISYNGVICKDTDIHSKTWNGNPFDSRSKIYTSTKIPSATEKDDYDWLDHYFTQNDIVSMDIAQGTIHYSNPSMGLSMILTKMTKKRNPFAF